MAHRSSASGAPIPIPEALKKQVVLVHQRLCEVYGCPIAYFHDFDPLSELVSALLSHRTKNADSARAFRALRAKYGEWGAVRDAPTREVEGVIGAATWPELKAPRLQEVLRRIGELRGELSLDFLRGMGVSEARAWLEALPGVGPKTSAAVLSFSSLRQRALPVDSHHHRVAARLGLISPSLPLNAAHVVLEGMLPGEWDAQQVYDHHQVMMRHGQDCCYPTRPACQRCPVLESCAFGQKRMARLRGEVTKGEATAGGEKGEDAVRDAAQRREEPPGLFDDWAGPGKDVGGPPGA